MKKLAIFDLDGTLVNTIEDVCQCFNDAIEACGFPHREDSYIASLVGKPLEEIVAALLPDGEGKDAVKRVSLKYREVYNAHEKPNTKPYPGIVDLLSELQSLGVKLAVNTNKAHEIACDVVERMFPNIDLMVSGYGDVATTKPSPEGAQFIMGHFSVSPEETVYIGDTLVDVNTAANAGVDCIWVTWGQGAGLKGDGRITRLVSTADELGNAIGEL